jgi:uncharacterized protein
LQNKFGQVQGLLLHKLCAGSARVKHRHHHAEKTGGASMKMQKFKIAENRMFQADGHDFIFLARDNTIYEMDPRVKKVVTHRDVAGPFTKEDFFHAFDFFGEDRMGLFEDLIENSVFVSSEGKTTQGRREAENLSIPLKTLVLHVTDACNLGCHYCYYCNDGQAAGEKASMSSDVAAKAVDFLVENSGNLEEVIIVFFGGEPLLNFGLISFIVEYARGKAAEKGIKIDFAMTTNGTLLDDETIGFLHRNQIGVTVSIDGYEKAHDRYRRFLSGAPSYQVILPGLKKLLGRNGEKPVVARVTVAGDTKHVPDTLDHLLSLGFSEAGFAPVTTSNLPYQLCEDEMRLLLEQFRELSEKFLGFARRDQFYGFTNLVDNLVVLHEGERKNYPCGAGLGLFSVDPKGRLYLCQRLTGEKSSHMGDIFTGFDQSALDKFRNKAELGQKSSCAGCWVRHICAGGCYHEALVREGSLTEPNLHYCRWIKDWVQMGLEVYGKLVVQCPGYLDKLSMLRGHEPLIN